MIEKSGSECLTSRDVVLARVVDHEGLSLFCGMHPLPLGPRDGAAFLEIARKTLGGRRNARLTMADLRTPGVATLLIAAWDDVYEMVDERLPPVLHNTDSELLVLVRDELAVTGALAGVRERLLRLPGATADEPDDDGREEAVAFVRQNPPGSSLENTVVGRALLAETTLVLETNLPSDEAFDVDVIRRELGLAEAISKRGAARAGEAAARR